MDTLAGTPVYVLPNPSGRNRAFPGFEKKLVWYRGLAEVLRSGTAHAPRP
jgi:TDG/mug DNA glycosylase family protein